jgi:hypothetical protein
MKPIVKHGGRITGPAFDEGREQRCALHLAVLMGNRFYAIGRTDFFAIAGRC